jgi:hypothetical protein
MAYTPRNAGTTEHAQGAYGGSFTDLPNPKPDNRDQTIHNRVGDIDIRKIAVDQPNDHDYDDPYPGGSSFDAALGG